MKAKKELKMILTDPKHWFGWALSTGAIIGVFHLFGVHGLHMPIWRVGVLFLTIVIVDSLKHITKLQ